MMMKYNVRDVQRVYKYINARIGSELVVNPMQICCPLRVFLHAMNSYRKNIIKLVYVIYNHKQALYTIENQI